MRSRSSQHTGSMLRFKMRGTGAKRTLSLPSRLLTISSTTSLGNVSVALRRRRSMLKRLQKPVPDHHKRQKAVSTSLCLTRLTCVLPLASMLPRLDCTLLQALRENILRTLPMLFAHWSTDTIRLLRMSLRVFVHLVRVRSSTVMAPCKLPSAWQQEAGSFLLLALVVRGPAINLALPNTGACIHRLAVFSSARRYDDAYSGNGPIIECPRACPSADATLKARWLPRPAGLRQPGAQ